MVDFSAEGAGGRWLRLRAVAILLGLDQGFGALVLLSYLHLVALYLGTAGAAARPWLVTIGIIHVGLSAARMGMLARQLSPIQRWMNASDAVRTSPEALRKAGAAAFDVPYRYAVLHALTWAIGYPLAALLVMVLPRYQPHLDTTLLFGSSLFGIALGLGSYALHLPLWGYWLAPVAGRISLIARSLGVQPAGVSRSLRTRVSILMFCLSVAPLAWVSSYMTLWRNDAGFPADGDTLWAMWHGEGLTLLAFFCVVLIWALLCARLLTETLASPVVRLAEHVGRLSKSLEQKVPPAPMTSCDELGALAWALNDASDELNARAERIQGHEQEQVEARRRLEALAVTEQQHVAELEAVVDHVVELVVVCDASGKLTLLNRMGRELFGLAKENSTGTPLETLLPFMQSLDKQALERGQLPLARALRGEIVRNQDMIIHPEGHAPVYVRSTAAPIRGKDDAIVGAVAVARDVSQERELELFKGQFIRVAAHELKTPVAVMKAHAQLLMRYTENPQRLRTGLETIDRGADRMHRIILDLLDISLIHFGSLRLKCERFDLIPLLESAALQLAKAWLGKHPKLELPAELMVVGDRERIQQVAYRIIENAFKHSPEGAEVEVRVQVDGECVVVSVTDHGVGIPAHKMPYIFQPFYRAHTGTPYDYGGFGVGLYIAREIMRRHGGDVDFNSSEGRGSTFRIVVPEQASGCHE